MESEPFRTPCRCSWNCWGSCHGLSLSIPTFQMDTHSGLRPSKSSRSGRDGAKPVGSGLGQRRDRGWVRGMGCRECALPEETRRKKRAWGRQILMANTTYSDPHCDRRTPGRGHLSNWRMGDEVSGKDWPAAPSAGSEPSLFHTYLGKQSVAPPPKKIPQVCNWVSTALYYPIMIQKHLASPLNVPGFLHL